MPLRPIVSRSALALLLAGVAACVAAPAPLAPEVVSRAVAAAPDTVLTAAARVLADLGFTLTPVDRTTGLVQTQPLELRRIWGDHAVSTRLDCGRDMAGVARASSQPVRVALTVSAASAGTSPAGTLVRVRSTASTYDQTARDMAGTNAVASAMSGATPCELTPAFVAELLDAIAASSAGSAGSR